MQTKQSYNVVVTSSQPLKKSKGVMPSIRKILLLFPLLTPLPKPGFKPIKQVHLYTKWRNFIPHHYKDITCPLPPNSIIPKVQKPKQKKKIITMIRMLTFCFKHHVQKIIMFITKKMIAAGLKRQLLIK